MKDRENKIFIERDLKLLNAIESDQYTSQRGLAQEVNFSIGKVNYVLRSLFSRGLVKIDNFVSSKNKHEYAYILTPKGVKEKMRITKLFLNEKIREYNLIKKEINELEKKIQKKDSF